MSCTSHSRASLLSSTLSRLVALSSVRSIPACMPREEARAHFSSIIIPPLSTPSSTPSSRLLCPYQPLVTFRSRSSFARGPRHAATVLSCLVISDTESSQPRQEPSSSPPPWDGLSISHHPRSTESSIPSLSHLIQLAGPVPASPAADPPPSWSVDSSAAREAS
ncbi:hypothetical protein B0T10DRAFT_474583 [Thelonectria olida]|uniref:Uncharacterized protein n=1 Tax=Thelonectria olida TaxID=1576542 RepID=A0A9P9ARB5_9HYPO|nr:hypothetical protein B0T10DRAFT_474583 [Thelonectria olida]